MKYQRLSKEQLEELHVEFINFLATQSITAEEWSNIKANKPHVAEEEIDIFSDIVWDSVLDKATYIEHFSKNQIHLFEMQENQMNLIALKVNNDIDLMTAKGYKWLQDNLLNDQVVFYNAHKSYSDDKNIDKFKIIQQGGNITRGDLYRYFDKMIKK